MSRPCYTCEKLCELKSFKNDGLHCDDCRLAWGRLRTRAQNQDCAEVLRLLKVKHWDAARRLLRRFRRWESDNKGEGWDVWSHLWLVQGLEIPPKPTSRGTNSAARSSHEEAPAHEEARGPPVEPATGSVSDEPEGETAVPGKKDPVSETAVPGEKDPVSVEGEQIAPEGEQVAPDAGNVPMEGEEAIITTTTTTTTTTMTEEETATTTTTTTITSTKRRKVEKRKVQ